LKTEKIIARLREEYPEELAVEWDNPGLQVGRMERPVKKVMVALDATDDVIAQCIEWDAQLLVTHHPLMLSGIRQVNGSSMTGRKVLALVENGISHYAMHTNYDIAKMADLAGEALQLDKTEVLEPTGVSDGGTPYGIGCCGELPEEMTAEQCCEHVKKVFGLTSVRLFGPKNQLVKKIAVCPGSGKGMAAHALSLGAELLVTGDIGHHDGLDAVDQGLLMIDAGHYGIEHIFVAQMAGFLREQFPELQVKEAKAAAPFEVL